MPQRQVARELDWSTSKLIRIEGGQVSVSVADLRALLVVYQVEPARVAELVELARLSRKRSSFDLYRSVASPSTLSFVMLEAEADSIRQFAGTMLPSILQTEEYCSNLSQLSFRRSTENTEAWLHLLLLRQEAAFDRERVPLVEVIIDEVALRRPIGGNPALGRQLAALIDFAKRPNLVIRVLPFAAGATPGLLGSFTLLDFREDSDTPVLWRDEVGGLITELQSLYDFNDRWELLASLALSPTDSQDLIQGVIDETVPDSPLMNLHFVG